MEQAPIMLSSPYELWREAGILHLNLNRSARIGALEIKEILRIVSAMDPVSAHPVLVNSDTNAIVDSDARNLLARTCNGTVARRVAFVAGTLNERMAGDVFASLYKPLFPFKVFSSAKDAQAWFGARTMSKV